MMREIKFRAWDKRNRTMLSGNDASLTLNGLINLVIYDKSTDMYEQAWHNDYVIMQYIDLKDYNGKAIYEGDILKVTDEDESEFFAPVIWYGKQDYPAFDLDSKYVPKTYYYEANILSTIVSGESQTCEVAGNIYQNPELLEEKHEK